MASSSPEVNLTRARELGKYSDGTESNNGHGRLHETGSRVLAVNDVDIIKMCAGCGKRMRKVKIPFVCSCKWAIHCSKDCFMSSKHKCEEPCLDEKLASNEKLPHDKMGLDQRDIDDKLTEVVGACFQRYLVDKKANKGPSSDKVARLMKMTRGDHRRILKYAEVGNPMASYVVGSAYAVREFDRREIFAIPLQYKEQSVAETDELAVKWLKVAATHGVPEAMFLLFTTLSCTLGVDARVAEYWLDQAHATGKMEYLIQIMEHPRGPCSFPAEFDVLHNQIIEDSESVMLGGQTLTHLLLATRFREIKAWGGKTAMGEPFFGWGGFKLVMDSIRQRDPLRPFLFDAEKKTVVIISARPGFSDVADKSYSYAREENNLKFLQGEKERISPDYQLVDQTVHVQGRTSYLISCKHDQVNMELEAGRVMYNNGRGVTLTLEESSANDFRSAGKCASCVKEARQRLRAVSLGQFSISMTPVLDENYYAARYANEDGVIMQDVFVGYSKPYMRQALQCLMSNPADLHPLGVAEDGNLYWPIIWLWGSVYGAVQDTCSKSTLDAIYQSLGRDISFAKRENASALAAFPEAAAGEWRIACGNENCPRVDHEVKFNLCKGCKVRRYCDAACQRKDWAKHKQFCKAGKTNNGQIN